MTALVLVLLAAEPGPIPLSKVIADAKIIVIALPVEADFKSGTSKLKVDVGIRGAKDGDFIELQAPMPVGGAGMFLVGAGGGVHRLWVSSRKPGTYNFSAYELVDDVTRGTDSIPSDALFKAVGRPQLKLKRRTGWRVITAECEPCVFDRIVQRELNGLSHEKCEGSNARRCAEAAWSAKRAFLVVQEWAGIDSAGREALIGDAPRLRLLRFDDDVTGGTGPLCSSAVFVSSCDKLSWRDDRFECIGQRPTHE